MKTSIPDPRHLANGAEIPVESYSDQPYVVRTDDGAWLCCVTTGPGHEGAWGQHVTTMRSTDQGRTWSTPLPVEPLDSPENSYAVLLKVPAATQGVASPLAGRIYIFYNHNTDNVREVKYHDGKNVFPRVDSLGHFVCKFSDDHGKSWSERRYDLPSREFACDRENVYGGKLRFFWNVGRPFIHAGAAYVSLHKVGQMGDGFFQQSEGVLLKSDNLLTERDPANVRWETLPDGDIGLRTPPGGGPISEEQSYSVLSDGSFYCVYRSIDGYPVECYSRDGGHTWTTPRYTRYADGRLMKHPRAATFTWKCANGKFLCWFHNHGGHFIREMWDPASPTAGIVMNRGGHGGPYDDRNPVWLCGGEEVDTPNGREIRWSQPEVALYTDDPYVRISYPDLIEEDGRTFLTETQKKEARVHELDPALLAGLWGQFTASGVSRDGLLLELPESGVPMPSQVAAPDLPQFLTRDMDSFVYGTKDLRGGFTLDLRLDPAALAPGQILVDGRTAAGRGLMLQVTSRGTVEIILNDGHSECRWENDLGRLAPGQENSLTAIVDGGPKLILFLTNGILDDGGENRQFGWNRFNPNWRNANGCTSWRVSPAIRALRVYGRALRVSEAIAAHRAGY